MRTTLDIDDEVLERLKLSAHHQKVSAGQLASRLLREKLDQPADIVVKNGVPVIRRRSGAPLLSTEQVDQMLEALTRMEGGI